MTPSTSLGINPARAVRKAVLPVAGLGTRFLPATKAQPKEMLPVADKPLIQYAVEEAVASGLEDIILVTSSGKNTIEQHFLADGELARRLEGRGDPEAAEQVRRLGRLAEVISVEQKEPRGLGHAVGCARALVGREPFAVLLPDDIIEAKTPCIRQLLEVHAQQGGCVLATLEVRGADIERYAAMIGATISGTRWGERLFRVSDLVEKPSAAEAPSSYAIIGRYVLEPEIFDFIDSTPPGRGGEIQLTDAIGLYARQHPV
ncbi:MAG: UTP--glucose-1-phosphate uridylyltransferase, partial [Candidatus Acidiferrales bacterium]